MARNRAKILVTALRPGPALLLALLLTACAPTPAPVFLPTRPLPTSVPAATQEPRLTVQVDIRDATSGQPVAADVWYTVNAGDDIQVAEGVTEATAELPPGEIMLKVQAEGYRLWWGQIHEWQRGKRDQVVTMPVKLERLE